MVIDVEAKRNDVYLSEKMSTAASVFILMLINSSKLDS